MASRGSAVVQASVCRVTRVLLAAWGQSQAAASIAPRLATETTTRSADNRSRTFSMWLSHNTFSAAKGLPAEMTSFEPLVATVSRPVS